MDVFAMSAVRWIGLQPVMRLAGRQFVRQRQPRTKEHSMTSTKLASIGLAALLVAILPAASAQAQAPRTFVSAAGSDTNPCSFAAPCRHFQAAVNATSAGGEVDALDPAGYGPITITQAITIEGQGWSYIAPPANGNGITINAVSGKVIIRGVSLNGVGMANAIGILFNSGASLNVENSVIENFSRYGILFQPTNLSKILIMNTQVSDNNYGIYIGPFGSANTLSPINGVLDHVHTDNNTNDGITVITANWLVQVTISDSVCANNGGIGVVVTTPDPSTSVIVRNSAILNNGGVGLVVNGGGGGTIAVTRSTIAGNNGGSLSNGGGALFTYNDNIFVEGSSPTQVLPYK
jgi:hypothetical protein